MGAKSAGALARVQMAAKLGPIETGRHSRERMSERGASAECVRRAIQTATVATVQMDGAIRLDGGIDRDGDKLIVVVSERSRCLFVVTVI
jgi:hypothetical protein